MQDLDTRQCEECGTVLHGRADQRFCSDQCRTSHHNRQRTDATNLVRRINRILLKNRRILEQLNPEGKVVKVTEEALRRQGFDFKHFTSTYVTRKNDTYYYCYDQGYLQQDGGLYVLVVSRDYKQAGAEG